MCYAQCTAFHKTWQCIAEALKSALRSTYHEVSLHLSYHHVSHRQMVIYQTLLFYHLNFSTKWRGEVWWMFWMRFRDFEDQQQQDICIRSTVAREANGVGKTCVWGLLQAWLRLKGSNLNPAPCSTQCRVLPSLTKSYPRSILLRAAVPTRTLLAPLQPTPCIMGGRHNWQQHVFDNFSTKNKPMSISWQNALLHCCTTQMQSG